MSAEVTDADRATALQLAIDMPGIDLDGGAGWEEHVAFLAQALADQRAAADDGLRARVEALADEMDKDPGVRSTAWAFSAWLRAVLDATR